MIRKETWIVLVLLVAVLGFAYYLNQQKAVSAAEATATPGPSDLFDPGDGIVVSLEIAPSAGATVSIARNSENAWAVELPTPAEADQGQAEAAATQLTSLTVVAAVEGSPEIFGVDEPSYVITVKFAGGKTHMLEVGDSTPTNSGYYVRVDEGKIVIVGLSGIDSLTNLVAFPPYLSTPTPSALPPTETATPPAQTSTPPVSEPPVTQTP